MEQLVAAQRELHGRIARTLENLRKAGSATLSVALVQSALANLEGKWTKFEDQHDRLLLEFGDKLKGHDYVSSDLLNSRAVAQWPVGRRWAKTGTLRVGAVAQRAATDSAPAVLREVRRLARLPRPLPVHRGRRGLPVKGRKISLLKNEREGRCRASHSKPAVDGQFRTCVVHPEGSDSNRNCPICKKEHFIAFCEQYKKKLPQERREAVNTHQRCWNCLGRHMLVYSGCADGDVRTWSHIDGLELADLEFSSRDPIELLLGADAYASIVQPDLRRGGPLEPIAQRTQLGWILMGAVAAGRWFCFHCDFAAVHHLEGSSGCRAPLLGRLPDGRYQVRLPVRPNLPDLSSTRRAAFRMLNVMARRFEHDGDFRQKYRAFMRNYAVLGHMSPSPGSPPAGDRVCYLPHHGVLWASGADAKIRVVFNGSSRCAAGTR
ncbi:hypothetical protein RF55_11150 [Lasius niger]|uniref:Uncharacterized protein n=1 Tax=Lasius niger TaxID=67767 RepID=A0A0J7KGA9_LASNI|nr:hypothetical protein RF55_11150 [Lasius niger]